MDAVGPSCRSSAMMALPLEDNLLEWMEGMCLWPSSRLGGLRVAMGSIFSLTKFENWFNCEEFSQHSPRAITKLLTARITCSCDSDCVLNSLTCPLGCFTVFIIFRLEAGSRLDSDLSDDWRGDIFFWFVLRTTPDGSAIVGTTWLDRKSVKDGHKVLNTKRKLYDWKNALCHEWALGSHAGTSCLVVCQRHAAPASGPIKLEFRNLVYSKCVI